MILVTAANGQLGGRIARCIVDRLEDGTRLAVSVRDVATASRLAARGADVRQADFDLPETLAAAFQGVARLVLIPSPAPAAERIRQHRNVIAAAREAGVGHIVFLSFLIAASDARFPYGAIFEDTEAVIRSSGLDYTFLRNSQYADNLLRFVPTDGEAGRIALPAGAGRVAFVSRDDIARAAAAVTLGHGHEGKTYELTGPRAMSFAEVAAILSSVHGTEIVYEDLAVDDFVLEMEAAGLPPYLIAGSIGMYTLTAEGRFDTVSGAIPRLTGRPAEGLEDFFGRILPG